VPTPKTPEHLLQEALDVVEQYGTAYEAIKALGPQALPTRTTLDQRAAKARLKGLKPSVRKDAPRIYTRHRIGRSHLIIPDTQVKPGVNTDHMEWIGHFIQQKQPDVIVMIGDWWDMPSLSSYDKGTLNFEGRRYVNDIKAGRDAMERLLAPIKYGPRKVFCLGNHEMRISRVVDLNAEYQGKFDLEDMGLREYGWEVVPFLKPIEIDGVLYCHYFTSGNMGRPVTSAAAMLKNEQQSCTMGHVQQADCAMHKKTQQRGLFVGTCYTHDEHYLGFQGNNQRRQIIMKHEVQDGRYDLMEVSLNFLSKAYA
jgi:hypothetical protein